MRTTEPITITLTLPRDQAELDAWLALPPQDGEFYAAPYEIRPDAS